MTSRSVDVITYKAQFAPITTQEPYKGGLSVTYVDYPLMREPETTYGASCPLCLIEYRSGTEKKVRWRVIQHLESKHCLIVNWAINGFEDMCTPIRETDE